VEDSAIGGRESMNNKYRTATGWRKRKLHPTMDGRERTVG